LSGRVAASGLVLPALLQACGGTAAPASSAADRVVATGGTKSTAGVLPTYTPTANGPKPDFPGGGPQFTDGFTRYPANPVKSMTGDPPGSGGPVTILTKGSLPLPTPLAQ